MLQLFESILSVNVVLTSMFQEVISAWSFCRRAALRGVLGDFHLRPRRKSAMICLVSSFSSSESCGVPENVSSCGWRDQTMKLTLSESSCI